MLRYFITRYAMTEIGAKNLKKSIFSHTVLNITKLFPPIIAFTFLFQYLGRLEGTEGSLSLSSITYIAIIIGMLLLMYFVARWDYVRLYNNVYEETASSRIEIANRMKKLPLSYFGKRDLTDLATTMMGDITLYEEIFSHAVPHIYSTIISTTILSLMILNYNWKLGIAALWVIPVAILIFSLSKKKQRKTIDKWIKSSRLVFDDLQENIEQIEEIKSYNLEEKSIHHFFEKLNDATKIKLETEFVSGISIAFSGILLKLGIVTVAIVGANMMIVGEINILVYIVFLIITSSIYLPIENILGFMALITLLDGVIARMKEIKTMPIQEGKTEMKLKNYDIEFKDVYFTYDEYSVINGVSFTAKQGEVTALIGPSGSGKQLLRNLLQDFGISTKDKSF